MEKRIRCALYDRVSTDLQARDGLSLDAQRAALTDYAKAKGYQIVDYYTDEGLTARKKMQNRRELLRLLDDVEAGKIDLILVTKLDRWFRNIKDYHNTQSVLEAHGCNWKTIFEEYDTTTANGRFAINIMLSVNENECDRDSDRIKEVFAYKRRKGEVLSGNHVSFGYKVADKKFVKDEATRHIVEDFFAHYFTCYSKRKTGTYIMHKYGDAAPSESTLMYMFKNRVYYGFAYDTENFCEPYITKAQFEEIKKIGSLKVHPGNNEPYVFSGLIKCPDCGHNFSGYQHRTKKPSGKVYQSPVYQCKQKMRSRELCRCRIHIYESTVEKYLLAHVDGKLRGLSDAYMSFTTKVRADLKTDPLKEIKKLEGELGRLNLQFQKARIDEDYYDEQYVLISDRITVLKNTLKDVSEHPYRALLEHFSGDWKEIYQKLDKDHKRAFWHDKIAGIHLDLASHKISDFIFLHK